MKSVTLDLTKKQKEILKKETGWPHNIEHFALVSQPYLPGGSMKILVLNSAEFKVANRFYNKFIPKKKTDKK